MTFLSPLRFVFVLMLLSAFNIAVPMAAPVTILPAEEVSHCQMVGNGQNIEKSCHNSEATESSGCLYVECDNIKHSSVSSYLRASQQVAGSMMVTLVDTHLYTIYSQPVIPPPIQV